MIGVFALDLAIAIAGAAEATSLRGPAAVFSSVIGLHVAVALAGLALAGGLFVVPAFYLLIAADHHAEKAKEVDSGLEHQPLPPPPLPQT